jgi:uncharacterized protein
MKRNFRATTLLLCIFSLSATVMALRPSGYVTDDAAVIDARTRENLEHLLGELERKTSAQIAVVTVKSLDNQPIETVANELFTQWGIGQKGKDNGILFLIAPQERHLRIEVGYGLEGVLPDGLVGRIRDEMILPYFKVGLTSQGVWEGTITLAHTIAVSHQVELNSVAHKPTISTPKREPNWKDALFIIFFTVLFMVVLIKNPWLALFFLMGSRRRGGMGGGGFGGGGFGGFGGGRSGGGGVSGRW